MREQAEEEIPDINLFMMCKQLNRSALGELSDSYHIRNCRKDELDIWKEMPFDDPKEAMEHRDFMTDYFARAYANKGKLFFKKCLFVCSNEDNPIATAFIWRAYDQFNTVQWVKVRKQYEGKGIGRALLSFLMKELKTEDYPVYLHTQPGSYRAIKLYSDFGFSLVSDPIIGCRNNDLDECLPILEKYMPNIDFKQLIISEAPMNFLQFMATVKDDQF